MQDNLHILPTVSYNRLGYGLSSSPPSGPRDASTLAKDLYILLHTLKLVTESNDDPNLPPIIIVAHSFGSNVARAFEGIFQPSNLLGVIFLDPPPTDLVTRYPKLHSFLEMRLPNVLKTATTASEMGLLNVLSMCGVYMIQASPLMKHRLSSIDEKRLRDSVVKSKKMIQSMQQEVSGVIFSMNIVQGLKLGLGRGKTKFDQGFGVIIISTEQVEKPMIDIGVTYEEWKEYWKDSQMKLAQLNCNNAIKSERKSLLTDTYNGMDHMSLCVSEKVIEAISIMITSHNITIKENK